MIYITGDTHGGFKRLDHFAYRMHTSYDDVMIILGDAGLNYFIHEGKDTKYSIRDKDAVAKIPLTFFCIHGNHEERPYNVEGYEIQQFFGADVYVNPKYPNQIFAKDGEIYNINGLQTLVIGGAYSVDKYYRLAQGGGWWPSEQPNDEIRAYVRNQLIKNAWKVDVVLSHTCPKDTEPTHLFLPFIDQESVDKSTEIWLQTIADRLYFKKWWFGHFHDDWVNGKYEMLFTQVKEFIAPEGVDIAVAR